MRSRIMYIEDKSCGLSGPARIGRVTFSKSGKTIYYGGRVPVEIDEEVREEYWTVIRGQPERAGEKVA